MMRIPRMMVLAAVIALVGCDPATPGAALMVSSPDVLVQVVEHDIRLLLRETWRVGHESDPTGTRFYVVRGAVVDSHGSTFVLDAGNDRVVVIDPTGAVVREFGGEGDGPGEFQEPRGLVVRRDTVFVNDNNRRIHFFASEGTVLSTHLLQFRDPDLRSVNYAAGARDGWIAAAVGYFRGGTVDLPPLLRVRPLWVDPGTGDLRSTGHEWAWESEGQAHNNYFWLQPVLIHRPALSLDGIGRLIVADTATYRLDIYGLDGEHQLRIENRVPMLNLDDSVLDLWKESRNCPGGPEVMVECSREMDRITLSLPRSRHRPVVMGVRAHPSGHFSVLRGDLDPNPFDSDSPSDYDHFDPQGMFVGSSSGTTPLFFDGRTVISLERDSLGVESVVRYEVERPASSPS